MRYTPAHTRIDDHGASEDYATDHPGLGYNIQRDAEARHGNYCATHCSGAGCAQRWFYPCCGACMEAP